MSSDISLVVFGLVALVVMCGQFFFVYWKGFSPQMICAYIVEYGVVLVVVAHLLTIEIALLLTVALGLTTILVALLHLLIHIVTYTWSRWPFKSFRPPQPQ